MAINALSYIGVNSDRIEDWSDYSRKCLGMQQVDRAKDSLSFRMDDQKQRLVVTGDTGDSLAFMGWEVEKKEDLKMYADRLENNNIPGCREWKTLHLKSTQTVKLEQPH